MPKCRKGSDKISQISLFKVQNVKDVDSKVKDSGYRSVHDSQCLLIGCLISMANLTVLIHLSSFDDWEMRMNWRDIMKVIGLV